MKRQVHLAIIVMGLSGLIAEILLLRELLIVFSGNELTIGIIFANWLILEAFGCFFSSKMADKSKNKFETFTLISTLFSLSLLISVFLTRLLKGIMGVSIGESLGLLPIFYSSLLIISPVSILHGALFPFSCRIYSLFSSQGSSTAGKVYVYETAGTIIAGVISIYLFIPHFNLNSFQISIGLAILNFIVNIALLVLRWKTSLLKRTMLLVLIALVFSFSYLLFSDLANELHHYSIQSQWKNQSVAHYQNSQYGNICVIENERQYIFFQDGIPALITPVPDIIFVEEFVHLPLLSHPKPEKILILSGGVGGVINEALKHQSIDTIEYAELDPLLLSLIKKFPTSLTKSEMENKRVKIKYVDGRLFLQTTPEKYDLIFIGIMEPSNLQANRFFTKELFLLAEKRLRKNGILVLGAPGSLTFLNEELKNLNSCIFHTLKSVFAYIRVIPADEKNIFLASDSQNILKVGKKQIIKRLSERGINTSTTFPWYIEKRLHQGWQSWFNHFIEGKSQEINYDFRPIGVFYNISYWNSLFAPSFGSFFKQFEHVNIRVIFFLFILSLLCSFFCLRNVKLFPSSISLAVFATGFAGMIFELVVIFAFQSIYGYVFSWIGVFTASFMAGAALGAMWTTKFTEQTRNFLKIFIKIELTIILTSIILPLVFNAFNLLEASKNTSLSLSIFITTSLVCGFLTGSQFPLANKLYQKNNKNLTRTTSLLYASDLLGGWLGGMVGSVVLLPVLGLTGTCITVGLLKAATIIIITTNQPQLAVKRG